MFNGWFVCLVYSLRSNILIESYSATTELLRKEPSQGTNLAQLKYDLSQNNGLVFVVFLISNFFFRSPVIFSSRGE